MHLLNTRLILPSVLVLVTLFTLLTALAASADRSTDMIAFASEKWRGYNMFDLLVMDTHTLETRTLTEGIGGAAYVGWSADGQYLLFTDEPDVIRIDIATCTRVSLTDDREGLHHSSAWGPSADRIAYLTSGGYFPEIMLSDGKGTAHRRLTDWFIYGAAPPAWSPDGTRLAVTIRGPEGPDIAVIDVETGVARNLTADAERNDDIAWSPDGAWLAFNSGSVSNGFRLEMLHIASGERRVIQSNSTFIGRPAWSADGERLAFVMREGRGAYHLYLYHNGTIARLLDTPIAPSWLAWSPDDTRIALVRVEGHRAMPHIVDVTRRLMLPLSPRRALYLTAPQWRPADGEQSPPIPPETANCPALREQ